MTIKRAKEAAVSYERAAEDVKYAPGIEVSKSVQQRLVHSFPSVSNHRFRHKLTVCLLIYKRMAISRLF